MKTNKERALEIVQRLQLLETQKEELYVRAIKGDSTAYAPENTKIWNEEWDLKIELLEMIEEDKLNE